MKTPASLAPQSDRVVQVLEQPVSAMPDLSDTLSQSLFSLIARQPFFKGLNARHLQLLTESALEMKFEPGQTILNEGSPANRFFLILEGKVVLESEVKERGTIIIQTLGPGDDLGWSWLFPPYSIHLSARSGANQNDIFLWDSSAGTVRTRPRTGISTHEAHRGSGDPTPASHAATPVGMHRPG